MQSREVFDNATGEKPLIRHSSRDKATSREGVSPLLSLTLSLSRVTTPSLSNLLLTPHPPRSVIEEQRIVLSHHRRLGTAKAAAPDNLPLSPSRSLFNQRLCPVAASSDDGCRMAVPGTSPSRPLPRDFPYRENSRIQRLSALSLTISGIAADFRNGGGGKGRGR